MNKQQQRQWAYAARGAQADKEATSAAICGRFIAMPCYHAAQTVLWYAHCKSEVRTLPMLDGELKDSPKCFAVPYCTRDADGQRQLGLWRLSAVDELVSGMWNIPEPPIELRSDPERYVDIEQLDLVMVPGVAFDRQGGRLGNGAGYYDRLFSKARPDTILAAVCYESQLLAEVAMEAHDVYMDFVVTEKTIYLGRRWLQR